MAKVLVIDSDEGVAREVQAALQLEHSLGHVSEEAAALLRLTEESWDVVVFDPDGSGVPARAILGKLRDLENPPELVVTSKEQRLGAVYSLLRALPFEFVPKPWRPTDLLKAVANSAQVRELRDAKRQIDRRNRKARRQLEALVEERTEQMEQIFVNVPALLFRVVVAPDGKRRFSFVSSNCEELLELREDVLLNNAARFDGLIHPDDVAAFRRARENAERNRTGFRFEARFLLRSGKMRWLQCIARPAPGSNGETAWDGIMVDVTERNQLQSQLLLSDRLAALGNLAAAVAHDVNNPLAYVRSNLAVLSERLTGGAVQENVLPLLQEVIAGMDRVENALRGVRTFARSEGEGARPVQLTDVLDASISLAENEIRHRARLQRVYESEASVVADESAMGQLFLNLLISAAHSIPEGTAQLYEIRVRVWDCAPGVAAVEISDSGPGYSNQALAQAFDPITEPTARSGLGLYVCHRIVTSLGGEIRAGRSKRGGNRFRMTLPASYENSKITYLPGRIPEAKVARVLVVDDDELVAEAMCRALEGNEVVSARSGREAIDLIRRGRFDLVLCDVMMPDLTGADVYEVAREVGVADRIVFVTGGAFTQSARTFLDSVPNRRIQKPFSGESVRSLLRAHQGA